MKALINKSTLRSLCEMRKVTSNYISSKASTSQEKVELWLNPGSTELPTFLQAKKIAKYLHVPFASLYMNPQNLPPACKLPKIKNLRTFQGSFSSDDSALNIAIVDIMQARDFYFSAKRDLEETLPSFSVRIENTGGNPDAWAKEIREKFQINLSEQFRISSARKFYLYIRKKIEASGVFIQCFSDVDLDTARGISIYDSYVPIIGLNANDRPPAKSFSIIHELTHILKHQSTLCNEMYNTFSHNQEEMFCNAVAGEVLVPIEALRVVYNEYKNKTLLLSDIDTISKKFCVSKEVIIRRLVDYSYITRDAYDAYMNECHVLLEREREENRAARKEGRLSGFPIPPERVAIDKTSSMICGVLTRAYNSEKISKQDVARYLSISQNHVDTFFREVSAWSN